MRLVDVGYLLVGFGAFLGIYCRSIEVIGRFKGLNIGIFE